MRSCARAAACTRIRDTKHFYASLHRQLYDPRSNRPRPLRDLFTSAHNAISFYFTLPRYRLRSRNAAGWPPLERDGRTSEKTAWAGESDVPFSTLPRLRVNQSQVDFSLAFLRLCTPERLLMR